MIEVELNEEERFLRFHLSSMGLGKLTQDDHRALADAAAQKDIDKAVGILNQHLCKGLDAMKNYLDSRPPAER
ncbi:hypothetical protein D3C86_2106730 [compost metagenome]